MKKVRYKHHSAKKGKYFEKLFYSNKKDYITEST